jgi:pSer/pThr/pTyr-binding forkhead associated (FHA) protein
MNLQLLVIAGPDKGRAFTLQAGPDLTLGRSPQACYQLNDPRVGRNHCQILIDGDAVTVVCDAIHLVTLVNGKPVKRQSLMVGDVLQIGASQLRLEVGTVTA